jgi:hypothetical protein
MVSQNIVHLLRLTFSCRANGFTSPEKSLTTPRLIQTVKFVARLTNQAAKYKTIAVFGISLDDQVHNGRAGLKRQRN